ncbi:MAG: SDR family oxidoreductase [Betaproteobacteria bacterium]|nr:SDR family oxidoreductase [Betaproteobacteria bacterium]
MAQIRLVPKGLALLSGKTALITGSLDGIGFAIGEALARKGCNVMLNGFGPTGLITERVKLLTDLGVTADYHGADLSIAAQVEEMVATTERRFGAIDIVVNNAVTRHYANIEDMPLEKWAYALAVNLSAPFQIIRRTMSGMKERKWGRIINLASNYGLAGTTRRADYVSTKHGLVGLTKVVALEGLPYNITCNALCPGATYTPNAKKLVAERMAAKNLSEPDAIADYMAGRQPSRRFIPPSKVGAFAAFLCTDDASEITGTPLMIDGGWLANS